MEERKGIKDLMDKLRFKTSHLQTSLVDQEVPGSWADRSGLQNVYNLVNGKVTPKDGYVFIFLSEFLQTNLKEIVMRYTTKEDVEVTHEGNKIHW